MSMNLKGKTVIVTGAGGGIGSAAAMRFAAYGMNVVVSDISDEAQKVAEDISSKGLEAVFMKADVANEESVKQLVQAAVSQYGKLDCAFNNAGIEQCSKPLHELSKTEWERAISIDLTGVFYGVKHQVLAMMKSGGGAIVNTASSLGAVAVSNAAEYVAAKHGVVGLTRGAAADYSSQGIRVNAVLPGIIETPLISRLSKEPNAEAFFNTLRARHPIGRFGAPDEVAQTVAWLFSDLSSFVTGAAITVDGGYLAV